MEFEFAILHWLQSLHMPWMDVLMKTATFLGEVGWIWILLGVLCLCFKKTRRMGAGILLSLLLGLILGNGILKNLIARQRPCWLQPEVPMLIAVPSDYSFPSGHTLAGVEASLSIFFFHKRWGIASFVLAALIAFSRMYLFVHFPTDILGGILLGMFNAWIVNRCVMKSGLTKSRWFAWLQ
ncbi:MAG: phosphatase PAP2 family protein [bacterium]|nr:phosphatase PAP2 family protein [bacterium]